jgi:hypothetical protein
MIVEAYTGICLLVDVEALSWTIRALAAVPGAMRITQRSTELVQLELEVPVRLVKEIRAMGLRIAKVFSLPKDIQYQPVFERRAAGSTFPDVLDEWT